MSRDWRSHRERATPSMLRLIVWLALQLPRRPVRLLLYPIVAYFLATSPTSRAASRAYLQRVLGRPATWRDEWRHFFAFASCTLDRIYLLADRLKGIDIDVHRPEEVRALVARHPGCLLFVAHFGSAEVLRDIAINRRGLPLSILLDREVGRMLTQLLEQLNPELAAHVIDASERGPALVLKLKEALEAGRMVGVMADRALATERTIEVQFLGGAAHLPAGPWMLAHALQAPIILGFGCYHGAHRYSAHFELLTESLRLPREQRDEAVTQWAQRFADRLAHHAREAPYNWFNFYDYWASRTTSAPSEIR